MSFTTGSDRNRVVLYRDPIASGDLSGYDLGGTPSQLGLAPAAIAAASQAIPKIIDLFRNLHIGGGGTSVGDVAQAIWRNLPPSAINAHVGEGGWWYDNSTNARLTPTQAADRQKAVVAAAIDSYVGADGWWYDNDTNIRLSYQDSIDRFHALSSGTIPGTITPGAAGSATTIPYPGATSPHTPWNPNRPASPTMAGFSMPSGAVLLGTAVALAFVLSRKGGRGRR